MNRKILMAPWRMTYLEGPKVTDCFICKAFHEHDDETNLVVARGARIAVMLNRYPYVSGHLMIVPASHVASFSLVPTDELTELAQWVQLTEHALRIAYSPDGFNIGVNLGEAAGAGLKDHLHVHMIPRWSGDTNFMTTCGDVRVIPQTLDQTWRKLTDLFTRLRKD